MAWIVGQLTPKTWNVAVPALAGFVPLALYTLA